MSKLHAPPRLNSVVTACDSSHATSIRMFYPQKVSKPFCGFVFSIVDKLSRPTVIYRQARFCGLTDVFLMCGLVRFARTDSDHQREEREERRRAVSETKLCPDHDRDGD